MAGKDTEKIFEERKYILSLFEEKAQNGLK